MSRLEIGWEEWLALPELKIPAIKAKIDTGAKTSALHAFSVEKIESSIGPRVRFGIHPLPQRMDVEIFCEAPLIDEREVISSNGQIELRYVIETLAQFGNQTWPIEITLTDRQSMSYRMLLGRQAMMGRLSVIPESSLLLGDKSNFYPIRAQIPFKSLSVLILSEKKKTYSVRRLTGVVQERGHRLDVLDPRECVVLLGEKKTKIFHQGVLLPVYDVGLTVGQVSPYTLTLLRQLEFLGTYTINSPQVLSVCKQPVLMYEHLQRAEIPLLMSVIGLTKSGTQRILKKLSLPKTWISAKQQHPYMAHTGCPHCSKALMVLVLGSAVQGVLSKDSPKGALSSWRNAKLEAQLLPEERALALRSLRVIGLRYGAVLMVRCRQGPKVVRVYANPSLQAWEGFVAPDLTDRLVEYLEHSTWPRLPKRSIGWFSL